MSWVGSIFSPIRNWIIGENRIESGRSDSSDVRSFCSPLVNFLLLYFYSIEKPVYPKCKHFFFSENKKIVKKTWKHKNKSYKLMQLIELPSRSSTWLNWDCMQVDHHWELDCIEFQLLWNFGFTHCLSETSRRWSYNVEHKLKKTLTLYL